MSTPTNDQSGLTPGTGPALALVSAGVTAWQLALMQLLAWVQWYHFAYLVISLALLGFGASGTVLTLARGALLRRRRDVPGMAAAATAATMAAAVPLLGMEALRFDLYLLFSDPWQWPRLAGACLVLSVPFFFAGLTIGLSLMAGAARAGRLYAWNLAGSGAGGAIGWLLLAAIAPARLPILVALLPLAGALLLLPGGKSLGWRRHSPVLLAVLVLAAAIPGPASFRPSQFKDISRLLELPDAAVALDSPDPRGWLQIVDAPAFRPAPPGSLRFTGEYPQQRAVLLDGNLRGSILRDPWDDRIEFLDFSLESVAWRMAERPRVLLMLSGGEGLAGWAVERGATEVVCAEPHPGIAAEVARVIPPEAHVARVDPRIVLAQEGKRFDVIRFPIAGAFGGSVGLQAVGEQFLHTREAFAAAFGRLTEDGVVIATAWSEQPERNAPRLLSTILAGLELAGVGAPIEHIVAVRTWNAVAFIVKQSPLSVEDIAIVRRGCGELEFDPLLLPGLGNDERERFHELPGTGLFAQIEAIMAHDAPPGRRLFRLGAATDARPYFSQFLKITRLPEVAAVYGWRTAPFVELGYLVVALSAPFLAVLALALIVAPLSRVGWSGGSRWRTAGFCAGLGFGFMFVEIGLIARLNLFLGGSLPAVATTLTSLLVFAGAGSLLSQRFAPTTKALLLIALAIAASTLLLGGVTGVAPLGADLPVLARACIAALIIAPGAFVMGMAFPTLLRFLESAQPSHVPWAWAVNGCASVVAPSVAVILAVNAGLPALFAAAAIAYTVAALAVIGWKTTQ